MYQSDLMAFGSRIYDRMLAFLDGRNAHTALTPCPSASPAARNSWPRCIHNQRPSQGCACVKRRARWVAFDWRITYRADDRREELFTVLMD
ncbi:MAG: hypothetical protein R3A10_02735 [Caldilineaceae bacterium]